jgi:hypothetical protein
VGLNSLYLDTNGNEKLNKKDLLIATGGFKQSLYKKKKGDLLATNREEAMFEAMSDLLSTPPLEDFNFVYNTGTIFTNRKGKIPDFIPLSEEGNSIDKIELVPIICSMEP